MTIRDALVVYEIMPFQALSASTVSSRTTGTEINTTIRITVRQNADIAADDESEIGITFITNLRLRTRKTASDIAIGNTDSFIQDKLINTRNTSVSI